MIQAFGPMLGLSKEVCLGMIFKLLDLEGMGLKIHSRFRACTLKNTYIEFAGGFNIRSLNWQRYVSVRACRTVPLYSVCVYM